MRHVLSATTDEQGLLPVDASVLVELVIAGRHRAGATALLLRYRATRPRLLFASAAHALVEAASALRRLVRLGALAPGAGSEAIRSLGRFDLALDPTGPRLDRIWSLRQQMSAYDAAYAAAAEGMGIPLVTVDGKLISACRHAGIQAVHLDDFSS